MLTALTLWTATLVALGPSPVQASYSEEGVSLSTEIVREEVTYALNVKALEIRGGNWLKLSISRSSDAAGSSLRQNQTWHFPLGAEGFTQEEGSWRIDAGSETGPFDIDLVVERRQDARCSDDQDLFVTVPEGGGLRVETGNNTFETITEVPACATYWTYSSFPDPTSDPPQCPSREKLLTSTSLIVRERRYSDIARFTFREIRELPGNGYWGLIVSGTIPATSFRLDREHEGRLLAAGAPWLSGRARFEPARPVTHGEWYDCIGDREARILEAKGSIAGDLTVTIIGNGSLTIAENQAWARRVRVRPRR